MQAGQTAGIIAGGYAFKTDRMSIRALRLAWNIAMFTKTRAYGGFQYSEAFLNLLWSADVVAANSPTTVNVFQLYPAKKFEQPGKRLFYLDQTLTDVFEYYGAGRDMAAEWKADVLQREQAQYHSADGVVFRSRWAADRAIAFYGLPADKVHVVLPGANIAQDVLKVFDNMKRARPRDSSTLKLIFIGKEWERKGLDRLLRAMHIAQLGGARLSLTVIGLEPNDLPKGLADGLCVNWIGYLDKTRDPLKFVEIVGQHDVGVLLSRREAGGVSLREFGRLGLPIIAPETGGSPEFAIPGQATFFKPADTDEVIAAALMRLAADRSYLEQLKDAAWEARTQFDWLFAVDQLAEIL